MPRKKPRKKAVTLSLFGALINEHRHHFGITEELLCQRAKIATSTYKTLIRSHRRTIRTPRIRSICHALNLDKETTDHILTSYEALENPWAKSARIYADEASSKTSDAICMALAHLGLNDAAEVVRSGEWKRIVGELDAELSAVEVGHPYNWLDDDTYPLDHPDDADDWTDDRQTRNELDADFGD